MEGNTTALIKAIEGYDTLMDRTKEDRLITCNQLLDALPFKKGDIIKKHGKHKKMKVISVMLCKPHPALGQKNYVVLVHGRWMKSDGNFFKSQSEMTIKFDDDGKLQKVVVCKED